MAIPRSSPKGKLIADMSEAVMPAKPAKQLMAAEVAVPETKLIQSEPDDLEISVIKACTVIDFLMTKLLDLHRYECVPGHPDYDAKIDSLMAGYDSFAMDALSGLRAAYQASLQEATAPAVEMGRAA